MCLSRFFILVMIFVPLSLNGNMPEKVGEVKAFLYKKQIFLPNVFICCGFYHKMLPSS